MKFFYLYSLLFVASFGYSKSGEEIYKVYCTTCHAPQSAKMFGAPASKNLIQWSVRNNLHWEAALLKDSSLEKSKQEDKDIIIINSLVASAIKGTLKGMPPKGTCMDCSVEDLKNAIIYMSTSK